MKKTTCHALNFFAKNPRAFAHIHFLLLYGLDALIARTEHADGDIKSVLQKLNESLWEYMLYVDCKQSRYSELRSIKSMREGTWGKYVTAHIIAALRDYTLYDTPMDESMYKHPLTQIFATNGYNLAQVDELKSFSMVGWISLFGKICSGEAVQMYSTELYKLCLAFPNKNVKQMYYNFNGV